MSLTNLVVILDSGDANGARLDFAVRLARRHGARLSGIFVGLSRAHRVGVTAEWPSEEHRTMTAAARSDFLHRTKILGEKAEFIDLNRGGEREILERAVKFARLYDLVVVGQWQPQALTPPRLAERLISESGRPILVLPHIYGGAELGNRPLFAWHQSIGAARALHDATQLLVARGAVASVVEVFGKNKEHDEFAERLLSHFDARGISANFEELTSDGIGLMDLILVSASDFDADLLVIGAFDARSPVDLRRGGGTRHILEQMTLPTLFSH